MTCLMYLIGLLLLPKSFVTSMTLCDKYCNRFRVCFTKPSCRFFSKDTQQWVGPYDRCNRDVQGFSLLPCLNCFPHWPCGSTAAVVAPAPAAAVVLNPSKAECEASCAEYRSCFTDDACAYVANVPAQKWSGPYSFCNAIGACGSCFPDQPCQMRGWLDSHINAHPSDKLAGCEGCLRFRVCLGALACTETSRGRWAGRGFSPLSPPCRWLPVCHRCGLSKADCELYPALTAAITSPLHDTDETALRLLIASQLLQTAACGTRFVSCGPVGGAMRVTGLDLDEAASSYRSGYVLQGGLTLLQNLTGLTFLRLPAEFHGYLGLLHNLTQLTHLSLTGPSITGSLDDLLHFPQLTYLSLRNTMVRGSIAALGRLKALEVLNIQGPSAFIGNPSAGNPLVHSAIMGPLGSLRGLHALRCLNLQSVAVSGALEDLARPSLQEVMLVYLALVGGSLGPSFKNLSTLIIKDLPRGQVPLTALNDMPHLKVLALVRVQVTGSISRVQGFGLEHLTIRDAVHVTQNQVDIPLTAVQEMHHLFTLSLANANVHGDVEALAHLSLEELVLEAASSGHITGTLHDLRRMPLERLQLKDCDVGGPLGILGNHQGLTHLGLMNVPVYGSLHFMTGLPILARLMLSGLDFRGDLQPLAFPLPTFRQKFLPDNSLSVYLKNMSIAGSIPPLPRFIRHLDLEDNSLFSSAPVVMDAPGLRVLNLKTNRLTNGRVQHLNLSSEALVNLYDNHLRCPLPHVHGVTVLAAPCAENAVLFLLLLLAAILVLTGLAASLQKHGDLQVPNSTSSFRSCASFVAFLVICRCLTMADLATDLAGNASMLQASVVQPTCQHAYFYWDNARMSDAHGTGWQTTDVDDLQVHVFHFSTPA